MDMIFYVESAFAWHIKDKFKWEKENENYSETNVEDAYQNMIGNSSSIERMSLKM